MLVALALLATGAWACDTTELEEPCSDGSEGCACYGNDTCDGELACVSGSCVAPQEDAGDAEARSPDVGADVRPPEEDTGVDAADASRDVGGDVGTDTGSDMGAGDLCAGPRCTPQECAANGWTPPSNLQRDTRAILREETETRTWEQFYGVPFPRGNARFLEIEPEHYVSFEFDTGTFRGDARVIMDNPQAAGPFGSRLATIGPCPGYFGPSPYASDPACRDWIFAIGDLDMVVGEDGSLNECELEPGRTYYLNIVPVDEVLPAGAEDLTWRCAIGDTMRERWDTCGALMEATFASRP
jgi:hypothetical protein